MIKLNHLAITTLFLITAITSYAQEIKIFPDNYEGYKKESKKYEEVDKIEEGEKVVILKYNVATPTITIYKAKEENRDGKTVIVSPGGAYNMLSYTKGGSEICEMLNENGFDAVLLKYRVPRREGRPKHEAPLEDLQRTISYVRANSDKLGINTTKLGVMGLSAGAHLSVMSCCSERSYVAFDEIDGFSCHPDFCILVYPAYLDSKEDFALADEVKITEHTPPTFITQAENDKNYINSSIFYFYALKEANIPATMHLFDKGGHGFGLHSPESGARTWNLRLIEWLNRL